MIEGRDTVSPQDARKDRGKDFWPEGGGRDRRRGPGPKVLFGAAAGLVAVVVAVVAAFALTGGDGEPAAAARKAAPTAYTPDFNGDGFKQIAARSADRRAITEGEAFGEKEVRSGDRSFTLATSKLTGDCASAAWGERLRGDLAKFRCTQVARAAYVSSDKRHVGQFFVINLESEEGVQQILRDLDPQTGAGWILPLDAPGVPAFGGGFSAAYTKTFGHYVVGTWVERAGGAQPATLNEMIDVSLVIENAADFLYGRLDLASGGQAGQ